MRVLTLVTPDTMPQAHALAESLRSHQPDWSLELVMVAGDRVVAAAQREQSLPVRSVTRELDLDVEVLLARYQHEDLTALLVPQLLRHYAKQAQQPVAHLPSSVWVVGQLTALEQALRTRDVLLVPRLTTDVPDDGLEPSRKQMQRAGRMDETVMAVRSTPAADAFLAWWQRRVQDILGSLDARQIGARPEDRPWLARYLELAPARFASAVLDDPGCNLSMWNLHAHLLELAGEGVIVDGRWPLHFLNLPGFDPAKPHRLNAMASRARVSRSPALRALCERYAQALRAAGWRNVDFSQHIGRRLADGLVYDEALRAMHATALALGEPFADPFTQQGSDAFLAWLKAPAPRGAAYGINRYVFHRVARERADVLRAYPDIDGADGAGFLAWCRAFGVAELAIPPAFQPPPPGQVSPTRVPPQPAPISAAPAVSPATDASSATIAPTPATSRASDAAARLASASACADGGPAVRLTGYLGHALGLGAAARGYAHALGAAGVQVSTVSVPLHHMPLPVELEADYGRHRFEDLIHAGRHGVEIVAVNADELPDFVERLGEGYFQGPRIGIWGWETNTIPDRWQRAFALVDEIWVYSRFMAENIGAVAPVPVLALPPPVVPPAHATAPLRLGVADGFLFLFVFDYLSTIQRKNPVGLIEAFKLAFAPGEGPQLLIKTINGPLRPLSEEEVLWAADGRPDVHVVDSSLTSAELDGVMAACDCYVSLHRAEGFGLTIAEAMAIGKPVIATGYSGNVDFTNAHNSYLVDYTIGRVGPECEIYPPEGEWAQPNVEHAAQLMRAVYEDRAQAARLGEQARADIARVLSTEATGAAMRARLEQLTRKSS
ncbi:MAG TPA: glycosyltransferase [Solirubrobacteraceae bacterium]|nr:glycosyltransferase [Solirubrobacteraceae bacterium]